MGRSPRKKPRPGPAHRHRPANRQSSGNRQAVLQDKLVFLWQKLAAERTPPALDRFLGKELGRLDGLPRTDRLWLGDLLTDAMRFGALTVFCEQWRRDGWLEETSVLARLDENPLPAGPELWRRLTRLPVGVIFYWTFMRKRLTGVEMPPVAPSGPGAGAIWKVMRETAADSKYVELRALWAGLPPALLPELKSRSDHSGWTKSQAIEFCDRHALRPPVGLRVLQPEHWASLQNELNAADFSVEGVCPSVAVRGPSGVYELAAYRQGVCDIQDRASQAIGDAVNAQPGDLIWDCCAGAGGKSLQLAAAVGEQGEVLATDLYDNKLRDLRKRAGRANLTNIRAVVWDGMQLPKFDKNVAAQGGFDRVLVDAPCSGTGTWRRNVDGRLRFERGPVDELVTLQNQLLVLAAQAVRPQGTLVYATCSWLVAENEAVVAGFCQSHTGWQLAHQAVHGSPTLDADTTFVAVIKRVTD